MSGEPTSSHRARAAMIAISLLVVLAAACSGTTTTEASKSANTSGAATGPGGSGNPTGPGGSTPVANGSGIKAPVDAEDAAANPMREDRTQPAAWENTGEAVEHLSFKVGPIKIKSGQNNIDYSGADIPRPDRDGFIVGFRPDLKFANGQTPGVDDVHLHHAVWVNLGAQDPTAALPERFFAAGEEKSIFRAPAGYGYPFKKSDTWLLNFMIHNLWPEQKEVWITYDVDFIAADAPAAKDLKAARPLWMDVQNGEIYPVFDAMKGSGIDGVFTYPDDRPNAYGTAAAATPAAYSAESQGGDTPGTTARRRGRPGTGGSANRIKNEWTVPKDMVLVGTAAHLHPGGLYSDMYVKRKGASATGDAAAVATGDVVRLFRSEAVYYEPAGPVSWDLSMTATPPDWRVALKQGDVLSINVSYDVRKASWYESMGISVAWYTDDAEGPDPFTTRVDRIGQVSHGHLPENDNHGGDTSAGNRPDAGVLPDPTRLTQTVSVPQVDIKDYVYAPGDMANYDTLPEVKAGGTLKFVNFDSPLENGIWHTITACKAPCNLSTGIAYPLADGDVQFDSGELGQAGPPTADRDDWTVPSDIAPGLYTYFCRIHPFMRGAFKVS